jgi:rod shape-determining protein MreC
MDYVVNDEKVKTGETVLTSGEDRIFPKGLLIGTVIDSKPAIPFQLIHVQPAARLDRLEDVIILLSQQELDPRKADDSSSSFALVPPPPAEAVVRQGPQAPLPQSPSPKPDAVAPTSQVATVTDTTSPSSAAKPSGPTTPKPPAAAAPTSALAPAAKLPAPRQ